MDILAAIGTVLGMVIVIVANDWRNGKPLFKSKSVPSDISKAIGEILSSQKELRQYYNHDQTEILNRIHQEIQSHGTKLDVLATKQQIILDQLMK